ncbi:MAG TPA: hypothetical protein VG096_13855 [Bryobacteraceae bacterium]|jgi:hypothetical protein|nr:hypothetical protein [Bryobacteraceae bacterium]
MRRNLFRSHLVLVAAILASSLPARAQGGGNPFAPYWQPPVVKGGPVARLSDGKPNMQGYWAGRFNQAIYDIEDHPVAKPGIPPGKGAIVDPPGGKIPYKAEAAAKAKDLRENHVYDEPEAHCFMSGVPHTAYQQFGFQILQPPGYVVLAYEYAHSYRIIPLDGRAHAAPSVKLFMGDSVGHWEGDTLVVDTTNQSGRTWFDMVGNFTTENIHVVERITPVDANNINYEATIDDASIYTRPWTIAGTWGRRIDASYEQFEFACIEGNQDLQHYTEKVGGTAKAK